jgi:hypothetical protein
MTEVSWTGFVPIIRILSEDGDRDVPWNIGNFKQLISPEDFIIIIITYIIGARGSVIGWGTKLQAGRSQVWFPMR